MRTVVVAFVIGVYFACGGYVNPQFWTPEVISGTPYPIQVVPTEDCPDPLTPCER